MFLSLSHRYVYKKGHLKVRETQKSVQHLQWSNSAQPTKELHIVSLYILLTHEWSVKKVLDENCSLKS